MIMPHYMVVSPEMASGFEYEACVTFVDAPNKGKAKALALSSSEFSNWRGHTENPFRGLKVIKTVCKHGICWCHQCHPDGCELCIAEIAEEA
jgi:hypothetical protein